MAHDVSPAVPDAATDALAPGEVVDRYVIVRAIGSGGMGIVYEARDHALDRSVALKLLRSDVVANDGEVAARLVREARLAAGLSHPNVVAVYAAGMHGTSPFIAMELVPGASVRDWLAERPRSWRDVVEAFVQAGRGLAAAHAAGIVHRDVKPDNILVASDRARVADFGLACVAGDGAGAAPST
jgi:serine/threonine protein kinase